MKVSIGKAVACEAPPVAQQLVYEAINEQAQDGYLVDQGFRFPVDPHDSMIYGMVNGDIVGIITYRQTPKIYVGSALMTLAYVEPSSRRCGVFSSMYGAFLDHLEGLGLTRVEIEFHARNEAGINAIRKCGFAPVAVVYGVRIQKQKQAVA